MEKKEIIPHLFRTEFSKITAVLCKHFGMDHVEIAEDIASETFVSALEIWPYQGIPEKPVAWLYAVAKNKAKNHVHRQAIFSQKIVREINDSPTVIPATDIDLSEKNITDSQLQMLFAICHPSISTEAQIGLSLRILCGFGIEEIANAFLTSKETINKRLFRAREKLRSGQITMSVPGATEMNQRLETVILTLYLLFNEGYYSESQEVVLRQDLCLEAMRLTHLLLENEQTNQPLVNALFALMCFHASRFDARKNESGTLVLYQDQDETLWNDELIARGVYYLHQATAGHQVSKYHIEASIAFWHTIKTDTHEKWEQILQLYNQLLMTAYSPMAALNRTYALSKVEGNAKAIVAAEKLHLTDNHFYYALLGELYQDSDHHKAKKNFQKALALAKTETDRQTLQTKIDSLSSDADQAV